MTYSKADMIKQLEASLFTITHTLNARPLSEDQARNSLIIVSQDIRKVIDALKQEVS